VAQASSSWQQLMNQIPNWTLPQFKTKSQKQRTVQRFREPGGYLGFLTIVVAMLLWNWKLLLALLVGIGVMVLVYSMHRWDWQGRWSKIRDLLNTPNSRLAASVGSGAIACLSTYMTAAIWVNSTNPWIAAGTIVQGLGTLLTLILLVWQIIHFYGSRKEDQLDELLVFLTDKDPLKRLIAVRQLAKLVTRKGFDSYVRQNLVDCLRLLLSREEELIVREAAFESLQALDRVQQLSPNTAIPFIPVSASSKHKVY
jgi:hypothetical protein